MSYKSRNTDLREVSQLGGRCLILRMGIGCPHIVNRKDRDKQKLPVDWNLGNMKQSGLWVNQFNTGYAIQNPISVGSSLVIVAVTLFRSSGF